MNTKVIAGLITATILAAAGVFLYATNKSGPVEEVVDDVKDAAEKVKP